MEGKIKIIDNSGDKKYFTILPNYILNHSTADEQALYMQMKRFAGESGECFATQRTLANKLGWGSEERPNRARVRKNVKELIKRGWIKYVGKKDAKTHPTDIYKIVDIWQANSEFYNKKKGQVKRHIFKKEKRDDGLRVISNDGKTATEEELNNKEEPRERAPTPSEEMKLFLKDDPFFNKIAGETSEKENLPVSVVVAQLQRFRSYWSELNRSGKKQKWELQKTFELKRRIGTWMRKAEQFGDIQKEVKVKRY